MNKTKNYFEKEFDDIVPSWGIGCPLLFTAIVGGASKINETGGGCQPPDLEQKSIFAKTYM